ncbi:MAG: hypothetical protein Q7S00_02085 [bacterium]|nr:hypothetical protein [bacterium]
MENNLIHLAGLAASVILPFFNIPLIARIIRRRSSEDMSLVWVLGVFVCIVIMTPAGLQSKDLVFKAFTVVNLVFFSAVTVCVLYFRTVHRR